MLKTTRGRRKLPRPAQLISVGLPRSQPAADRSPAWPEDTYLSFSLFALCVPDVAAVCPRQLSKGYICALWQQSAFSGSVKTGSEPDADHLGGLATDSGLTWRPTIDIDSDVHQVCAHPARPDIVIAAAGLCISRVPFRPNHHLHNHYPGLAGLSACGRFRRGSTSPRTTIRQSLSRLSWICVIICWAQL
jgi:hypothetical protein